MTGYPRRLANGLVAYAAIVLLFAAWSHGGPIDVSVTLPLDSGTRGVYDGVLGDLPGSAALTEAFAEDRGACGELFPELTRACDGCRTHVAYILGHLAEPCARGRIRIDTDGRTLRLRVLEDPETAFDRLLSGVAFWRRSAHETALRGLLESLGPRAVAFNSEYQAKVREEARVRAAMRAEQQQEFPHGID